MSHHYIRFTDVSYTYPGAETPALDHVSLHITHGERVALLGLNGAGKSTLLLHCDGLLLPDSGEVNIGDVPVARRTLPLIRRSVGYVFQNADDQLFMPTVAEDVAFGPRNMRLPEAEIDRRVRVSLEAVGALNLADRSSTSLSGGQRRAVAIATVLAMEPSILVMDEPSNSLDYESRKRLIDILEAFNHTILLSTHDFDLARRLCPRSILMDKGRIVADGQTDKILSDYEL